MLLDKSTRPLRWHPRNAPVLQIAVVMHGRNRLLRANMLALIEKKLTDAVLNIHAAAHANLMDQRTRTCCGGTRDPEARRGQRRAAGPHRPADRGD